MVDRRVAVAELAGLVVPPRQHRAIGFERDTERVTRADRAYVVKALHAHRRRLIVLCAVAELPGTVMTPCPDGAV